MIRAFANLRRRRRAGVSTGVVLGGLVALALVLAAGILIGRGAGSLRYDAQAVAPAPGETVAGSSAPGAPAETPDDRSAAERAPRDVTPPARPRRVPGDASGGAPPIRFDPVELDFGTVPPDTDMHGTFTITNVSDEPLVVAAVTPDCKCTAVDDFAGQTIPPGGSIEASVLMEGPAASGNKKAGVAVIIDGFQPTVMRLRARIGRAVTAEPYAIRPGTGDLAGELVVSATDSRPFSILSANDAPPTYVDGFDPQRDAPRTSYRIRWDLSRYDPQTCRDSLGNRMPVWWIIETDHPDAPIVDVQVRHVPCSIPEPMGERKWVLSKQRIILGALRPGAPTEFSVFLKWLREIKPTDTIREVRSESDDFEAELLGTTRDGDKITCRVRVTPREGVEGLFKGDVRFFGYLAGQSQPLTIVGRVEPVRTGSR